MNTHNNGFSGPTGEQSSPDGINDATLLALSRELDALAAADRAGARPGLEARVAAATAHSLRAPAPALRLAGTEHASKSVAWFTPLRVAAGLALAVTVGAVYLARQSPSTGGTVAAVDPASAEQEISEWLAISGGVTGDLATQISRLDAETSSLTDNFLGASSTTDSSTEEGSL